ncbi:putative peroxiredoxin bcp [Chlamydiales bacterium STE3]|nr:putative peroxiredoxin bcp [Chlamydiales bacterium STE3]
MHQLLNIGDDLPSFTCKGLDGEEITKEDLLGAPFVLYFYPKDGTPGCTKEACSFRDVMGSFDEIEISVFGVSPDSPKSHLEFMEKYELNFPLLSDEKKEFSAKCGILDSSNHIVRTTFICDSEGVILWLESPVDVSDHVQRVLKAIEEVLA